MKLLSLLCLAVVIAAGFSGCGSKACCKDKDKGACDACSKPVAEPKK